MGQPEQAIEDHRDLNAAQIAQGAEGLLAVSDGASPTRDADPAPPR
jgi:hypothetical protein